ncbi:MAG: leishmanolysin-related zinc metalloendopeptidase [Gemmatimonadaceae bacterium]
MMPKSTFRWTLVAFALAGACKDNGPPPIGPPAALVPIAGALQAAPANTELPAPIQLSVRDANGNVLGAGHVVTFAVVAGGGSITGTSATSDASGTVTAPAWRLGKSAVPQTLRATLNAVVQEVGAIVATEYQITVRFWGDPMSMANQLLFANAAARISGFLTGDVIDADARNSNLDLEQECDITGQPVLNEIIDDVLVFASIRSIDGPGNILGRAGPCLGRETSTGTMIAIGFMEFDSADLDRLASGGSLQEVITHEMLHVVGFGTLWNNRALLTGSGTSDPRFTGMQARQGCAAAGSPVTCANSVPVEGTGGSGTANAHWRESTFVNELMTGFIDAGTNPLSAITIASLADLGFTVNMAAADTYAVPLGLIRANNMIASQGWEQIIPMRALLHPDGRVERVRMK